MMQGYSRKSLINKIGLLAPLLFLAGLSSCSKDSPSQPTTQGRDARIAGNAPNGVGYNQNTGNLIGRFVSQSPTSFQSFAQGLANASIDGTTLGYVDNTGQATTGIAFGGQAIIPGTGVPGPGQTVQLSNSSYMVIFIVDQYAIAGNGSGQTYSPVEIGIPLTQGSIANQGGTFAVNLVYGDDRGSITLTGTVSGSLFQGTVTYNNTEEVNTSLPASPPTPASFSIPVNNFFTLSGTN